MGTRRDPVKARKNPERTRRSRNIWVPGIAARIMELRKTRSQVPGKELGLLDLSKLVPAPYSNVKQWFYEEKIGSAEAVKLAAWANCSLDWLLAGIPEVPKKAPGGPNAESPTSEGKDGGSTSVQRAGNATGAKTANGAEIAAPDASLTEALAMIGKAVGAAVRRVVEKDLLENTTKARQSLAENLRRFALELQRGGVDATELFDVAQQIADGRLLK